MIHSQLVANFAFSSKVVDLAILKDKLNPDRRAAFGYSCCPEMKHLLKRRHLATSDIQCFPSKQRIERCPRTTR